MRAMMGVAMMRGAMMGVAMRAASRALGLRRVSTRMLRLSTTLLTPLPIWRVAAVPRASNRGALPQL